MKRLALAVALSLLASLMGSIPVWAEVIASDLSQFDKGKSTLDQVVAKLGQPTSTEVTGEGLKGIIYAPPDTSLKPGAALAMFGVVDGVFTPGAPAVDPASGQGAVTAFVFDRAGRLLYYRSVFGPDKAITSEDGAAEMPNVKLTLAADKIENTTPDDGKPHLGIQLVPISDLDEQHRNDFAAAKFDGVVVANVIAGSVAEKAGLRVGDYLYVLNGTLVTSFDDAARAMATIKSGDMVLARAKRIDEATHLARETVFTLNF